VSWSLLRARRDQRRAYIALYSTAQQGHMAAAGGAAAEGCAAPEAAAQLLERAMLGDVHPLLLAFAHRCGPATGAAGPWAAWRRRGGAELAAQVMTLAWRL
jgi:hypothetical protein